MIITNLNLTYSKEKYIQNYELHVVNMQRWFFFKKTNREEDDDDDNPRVD